MISFHICQLALSKVCFQLSFLHNPHCEITEKAEGYSDNKSLFWNKENISALKKLPLFCLIRLPGANAVI